MWQVIQKNGGGSGLICPVDNKLAQGLITLAI